MTKKLALVTGAARGIGLATSKLFIEQGWDVAQVDRDGDELTAVCAAIGVHPFIYDVSKPDQVEAMVAAVLDRFGRIDAVVNNAGVADFGPIEGTDFARWRRVMETNLDGVFLVSQATVPSLKKTKGALVNIASISGLRASTLRVAYGTSKAALAHLTKQQAAELASLGIRVNAVAPGITETDIHGVSTGDAARVGRIAPLVPVQRAATAEEIAETVLFLLSDAASYVTGSILRVGGGR